MNTLIVIGLIIINLLIMLDIAINNDDAVMFLFLAAISESNSSGSSSGGSGDWSGGGFSGGGSSGGW